MKRTLSCLLGCAVVLLALAPFASASDGVTLINQATATRGLPGCANDGISLITICQSGSYELSGNLQTNGGQNGIDIDVSNVTLNLNGFTILGSGMAWSGVDSSDNLIRVENGRILGFFYGLVLYGQSTVVTDLAVEGNNTGAWINQGAVRDSTFAGNQYASVLNPYNPASSGPIAEPIVTVQNSVITGGQYGVVAGNRGMAVVSGTMIAGATNAAIYQAKPGPVDHSRLFDNAADFTGATVSAGNNFCSDANSGAGGRC